MKILLILSTVVGVTLSATGYAPAFGKYCHYQKQLINVGEKYYPPRECMEIACEGSNGKARQANYLTCPPAPRTDSPDFMIVERRELRYPECCPTLSRKTDQRQEQIINNDIDRK